MKIGLVNFIREIEKQIGPVRCAKIHDETEDKQGAIVFQPNDSFNNNDLSGFNVGEVVVMDYWEVMPSGKVKMYFES